MNATDPTVELFLPFVVMPVSIDLPYKRPRPESRGALTYGEYYHTMNLRYTWSAKPEPRRRGVGRLIIFWGGAVSRFRLERTRRVGD